MSIGVTGLEMVLTVGRITAASKTGVWGGGSLETVLYQMSYFSLWFFS